MKILTSVLMVFLMIFSISAQDDIADEVFSSSLTKVGLPGKAYLVRPENIPESIRQALGKIVETNASFSQGESEVFVLTEGESKKTDVLKLRNKFENSLRSAGFNYELSGRENDVEFFTAIKKSPNRQNIFGFWVKANGNLLLAMTEVRVNKETSGTNDIVSKNPSDDNRKSDDSVKTDISTDSTGNAKVFTLSGSEQNINVMGNSMPPMPSFPALAKKPGKIRGYVKDLSGNFLRGAALALGSIRIGSSRVISQTVTDSKGYYELDLPLNSGQFHYAAYALDYGAGRAAMSLHPADGNINDNPPGEGGVENFVLLPYGIANRELLAQNSNYSRSFYGGAIALYIDTELPGAGESVNRGKFQIGSQIEITLTPLGKLIDGSPSEAFVIRKKIDDNTRNEFFINNIPVGKYRLTIKTERGKPVGMKQRLPENSVYGINPSEVSGETNILFYPGSGNPTEIGAGSGGWNQVEIFLQAPRN